MEPSVLLYSGDSLLYGGTFISGLSLGMEGGDTLLVRNGGVASGIEISADCLLELEAGAVADNVQLLQQGVCRVHEGARLEALSLIHI